MTKSSELIPIEQKVVDFYGDELTAVQLENGRVFASVSQMCSVLGLDAQAQRRRIERHTVLANGLGVAKLATPGGIQPTYVLRADLVPLWLSGVRASAVKEAVRPKLLRLQEEAAAVLWEAFQEGRLTTDPSFQELLEQDTPEVQAYQMLQGMLKLARNQIIIRAQLEEHENRLEAIESQLAAPDHVVTQAQAMQISQAVKAVAIELGKQTKRNEFGGVYGEMYRKFEVTSYKALPAAKFEECLAWLTEWHTTLTNEAPF